MLHEHIEKEMKANLVLEQRSALNENTKVSNLSQEVVRILLNCSEELDNARRLEHLEKFTTKMSTSGYKLEYIRKMMVNGIKCYERKLLVSKMPETDRRFCPLHLPKAFRAGARRDKKMLAKTNWFKGKKMTSPARRRSKLPKTRDKPVRMKGEKQQDQRGEYHHHHR